MNIVLAYICSKNTISGSCSIEKKGTDTSYRQLDIFYQYEVHFDTGQTNIRVAFMVVKKEKFFIFFILPFKSIESMNLF